MEQIIIFKDDTEMPAITIYGAQRNMLGANRESLAITVQSDYGTIKTRATADQRFTIRQVTETPILDADGKPTGEMQTETTEFDKNTYVKFGDIVDHQDGTITFYLGQKTDVEKLEEENAELLFNSLTGEAM